MHAPAGGTLSHCAALLHRFFLPLLLATYAASGVFPGPGVTIREYAVALPGGHQERVSMLLLAVLLFCAAAVIEWSQVRELVDHPSILLAGLLTGWFGLLLLVVACGALLAQALGDPATEGLLVGLALVAAMPVANSAAGWTQNARGNVTLSLGLIVLSILLSPLATPNLLKLMGLVLSAEDTDRIEQVVEQFSGWRFILWVILPSLAGAAAAWRAGPQRIARAKPAFRIITMAAILTLNYANASLAIERLWASEPLSVIALAATLAVAVSSIGWGLALLQARAMNLSPSTMTGLGFSLSMKHTGLALVLAGEVLHDQPRVILVILLSTLAQHLVAAAADRRLTRSWRLAVR